MVLKEELGGLRAYGSLDLGEVFRSLSRRGRALEKTNKICYYDYHYHYHDSWGVLKFSETPILECLKGIGIYIYIYVRSHPPPHDPPKMFFW